jgi:prolyl oligopeptidase
MPASIPYPHARQDDVHDNYHGTLVADPYRWLEDDHSPDTQAWVAVQNALLADFLDDDLQDEWTQRLARLWNFTRYSVPTRRGDAYFFSRNDGLQNQPVLYQQNGPAGDPAILLDPNTLSTDGTVALVTKSFSKDGQLLAYALSSSGSDWQEIRLLDTTSGYEYDEVIRWTKFTIPAWMPDGKSFFYSRYPEPGSRPDAPPSTHHRVYRHRVGTAQDADELVYARPDAPELSFHPQVTEDGNYLALTVWHGTDVENRFYYQDLSGMDEMVLLLDEADAMYAFIGNFGTRFYFHTNLEAPNGRIIAIDVQNPGRENWVEIVPEAADAIDQVHLVNNQLVVLRLHRAAHQVHLYDREGTALGAIPLPGLGTIAEMSGRQADSDLYLHFQSFLQAPVILHYDFPTASLTPWRGGSTAFDPAGYVTTQHAYLSPDGTEVTLFLTHKADLARDGNRPVLLYGYGGFAISHTPTYNPFFLAWLEAGGVLVDVNLRGGSEYGEEWHRAGMLANKQNVFDDFMAAAEWLVAENITRPEKLAIYGRSNGGLLVSACLLQRPELFGAVLCVVPVIDMLRYHKFTVGRYWTGEYGNAEANADHFQFMIAYSPLHNVQSGVAYPPVLITTADTDDRVVPLHARKFAATLQAAGGNPHPVLLRVETRAGHGLGKPTSKLIAEFADMLTFLTQTLEISLPESKAPGI